MNELRYHILEWSPFPGHFRPIPVYELQRAEWALQMNHRHYHEHAQRIGDALAYTLNDAQRIAAYCATQHPTSEYQLKRTGGDNGTT